MFASLYLDPLTNQPTKYIRKPQLIASIIQLSDLREIHFQSTLEAYHLLFHQEDLLNLLINQYFKSGQGDQLIEWFTSEIQPTASNFRTLIGLFQRQLEQQDQKDDIAEKNQNDNDQEDNNSYWVDSDEYLRLLKMMLRIKSSVDLFYFYGPQSGLQAKHKFDFKGEFTFQCRMKILSKHESTLVNFVTKKGNNKLLLKQGKIVYQAQNLPQMALVETPLMKWCKLIIQIKSSAITIYCENEHIENIMIQFEEKCEELIFFEDFEGLVQEIMIFKGVEQEYNKLESKEDIRKLAKKETILCYSAQVYHEGRVHDPIGKRDGTLMGNSGRIEKVKGIDMRMLLPCLEQFNQSTLLLDFKNEKELFGMVGLLLSKGEITLETIEMLAQFERDGIFLRDLIWNIQMWNNKDEEIVEIFIKFIRSIYNSDPNYFIEYFNQYDIMNIIVQQQDNMKIVKLLFKILEVVDFVQLRVPDDNEYLLLEYLRLLCKKQGQIDDWLLEQCSRSKNYEIKTWLVKGIGRNNVEQRFKRLQMQTNEDSEIFYVVLMQWLCRRKMKVELEEQFILEEQDIICNEVGLVLLQEYYLKCSDLMRGKIMQNLWMLVRWNQQSVIFLTKQDSFLEWIEQHVLLAYNNQQDQYAQWIWDCSIKLYLYLFKYMVNNNNVSKVQYIGIDILKMIGQQLLQCTENKGELQIMLFQLNIIDQQIFKDIIMKKDHKIILNNSQIIQIFIKYSLDHKQYDQLQSLTQLMARIEDDIIIRLLIIPCYYLLQQQYPLEKQIIQRLIDYYQLEIEIEIEEHYQEVRIQLQQNMLVQQHIDMFNNDINQLYSIKLGKQRIIKQQSDIIQLSQLEHSQKQQTQQQQYQQQQRYHFNQYLKLYKLSQLFHHNNQSIQNDQLFSINNIQYNSHYQYKISKHITKDKIRPLLKFKIQPTLMIQLQPTLNSQVYSQSQYQVQWIKTLTVRQGYLTIADSSLIFYYSPQQSDTHLSILKYTIPSYTPLKKTWQLSSIKKIQLKRYINRYTSIQVFLISACTLHFNFYNQLSLQEFLNLLIKHNKGLSYPQLPIQLFQNTKQLHKWYTHQINNLNYLMSINFIASRSYTDLTQYPVFPWIVHPGTTLNQYRDLTKPMGAIGPSERQQVFQSRYQTKEHFNQVPQFHYGSHFSSPAIIYHYLIRLKPFSDGARELQSGKFDIADRLFFSFEETYRNATEELSDVRELIPEFYYLPEMFLNLTGHDFGIQQNGVRVDHVELPSWCEGDPYRFVVAHRLELEGEYVSKNIHHWIDLIFGYKQRNEDLNTYYHLTYEDCNVLENADERDRISYESQTVHFGQTPSKVFERPHPQKGQEQPIILSQFQQYKSTLEGIICVQMYQKDVVMISRMNGIVNVIKKQQIDKEWVIEIKNKKVQCFHCKQLYIGGFWDGRLLIFKENKVIDGNFDQEDSICKIVGDQKRVLITGSKSGQVILYLDGKLIKKVQENTGSIIDININNFFKGFATTTTQGWVHLYNLYSAKYYRSYQVDSCQYVQIYHYPLYGILISTPNSLLSYSINGQLLHQYSLQSITLLTQIGQAKVIPSYFLILIISYMLPLNQDSIPLVSHT